MTEERATHPVVSPPQRWLIAGPIGAGKSTVGRLLAGAGFTVIDADRIGHEVLRDPEVIEAIAARWPETVSGEPPQVDRAALARIVFADPDALEELEAITHPRIRAEIARRVSSTPGPVAVVIPFPRDLLGPGWYRVVVWAPADVRRARLIARGMDPADIERRIAAQADDDAWRAWADAIVDNSGPVEDLSVQLAALGVPIPA